MAKSAIIVLIMITSQAPELDQETFYGEGQMVASGAIKYSLPPISADDIAFHHMKANNEPEDRKYHLFIRDDIITYAISRQLQGVSKSGKKWWKWERLTTLSFSFRPRGKSGERKVNIYMTRKTFSGRGGGIRNISPDSFFIYNLISDKHLDFVIEKFNQKYVDLIGSLPLNLETFLTTEPKHKWFMNVIYPISGSFRYNAISKMLTSAMKEPNLESFVQKALGCYSLELEKTIKICNQDALSWGTIFRGYVPLDTMVVFFKNVKSDENFPGILRGNNNINLRQIIKACDFDTRKRLLSNPSMFDSKIFKHWDTIKAKTDLDQIKISTESWRTLTTSLMDVIKEARQELCKTDNRISDENFIKVVSYFLRNSNFVTTELNYVDTTVVSFAPNSSDAKFAKLIDFGYKKKELEEPAKYKLITFGYKDRKLEKVIKYDDEIKAFNDISLKMGEQWQQRDNFFTKTQTLSYMKEVKALASNYLIKNKVEPTSVNVLRWLELIFFFTSDEDFARYRTTGLIKKFPKIFYWYLKNDFEVYKILLFWQVKAAKETALMLKESPYDWVQSMLGPTRISDFYKPENEKQKYNDDVFSF